MANFALLWKARIIDKYKREYEQEKINSVLLANVEIPKKTLMQKWSHYSYSTRRRLTEKFRDFFPEGSTLANFFVYLTTDQTFANFVMKSVIGFIAGIVSTYLSFMFFVFQLSISLMHATIMSSIMGVLLTLGLAFSYRVRCLVFLSIPQFFSRVGRYTLTCYALVLILTGPATNTLKNSEVLSESMACSQEQIKHSVKHYTDSISNPYNALKDWVGLAADGIRGIAARLRTSLVATHRVVIAIAHVLESSFLWLKSVTKTCNDELGTPYQHCLRIFHEGIHSSMRYSTLKSQWWNSSYLANMACDSLKPYSRFCGIADYTRTTVVATMKRRLKDFVERFQSMLRVKVHVHHSYSFSSNASQSASQVAAGIVTEIRNRADPLLTWLSWSSCVTSLFLFLIIFRAKNYQYMYETRSRFDNRYITKELRNLDFERLKEGKETVLPLNRIEKTKYITTTSFRLLASEKVFLERSVIYMIITTCKLLIHIVADYSLFWVLVTIRYHGRFQTPMEPGPSDAGLQVSGTGPMADLLRSLIGVLTLPLCVPPPSVVTCLPNPYMPDLHRYAQIGVLICLLWSSALFEPYGLRLRHVIMGLYRPERAKARAQWLYNHILRTRGGLMKFARRKLHKEYKYLNKEELTFVEWLDSKIPCWWLRYLLGTLPKEPCCLLCGIAEYDNGCDSKLCRCDTPKCPGIYCAQCYSDLGELCTICLSPVDYGDLSDISLEKGSSEDSSSDGQDFDEQTESEDDEYSKLIRNFYNKHDDDIQVPESSKRRSDSQVQCLVFHSKSECSEEILPLLENDGKIDANSNEFKGFRRKANLIRSLKHCNSHRELITSNLKIIPLATFNEELKDSCVQCNAKFSNEMVERYFSTFEQSFPQIRNEVRMEHKERNKRAFDLGGLCSNSTNIGNNYKYKRKEKLRMRNISKERLQKSLSIDRLASKLSKLQYRNVNFSPKHLRRKILLVTRFKILKKNASVRILFTRHNPRTYSSTSFYSNSYNMTFNFRSISITRVTQPNDLAKTLRRKYSTVFRCKSAGEVRSNMQISPSESNSCSCKFIKPENISSYCKGLCFTKSSKSSDNDSQRPLSDKEKSNHSKKNSDKNDFPEKTNSNENNKAGKGDNNNEEKLDSPSACYCMKRLRRFCCGRDKSVTYTPCSLFRKIFRKNSNKVSSTANFKKRKKDEIEKEATKNGNPDQILGKTKEDDVARIYRISTYFGQQEWMKRQFDESDYLDTNKKRLLETQSDITLHKLKLHPGTRTVCFGKTVKINENESKKGNTKPVKTNQKGFVLKGNLKKCKTLTSNDDVSNQKSILTHKWFDNYYSLLPPTASALSLKTIMRSKKGGGSMSTDFGMSRSLRYYCSIGNTEFDQIDCPDEFKSRSLISKTCRNGSTTLLPVKVESEYSPLKGCCYSSEELCEHESMKSVYFPIGNAASSIAFNLKTEFDLLSRPVRNIKLKSVKKAMSDRILHLRIRNPFPLVKDFYSGLIDSKMRRASDRVKDIKEVLGKSKAVAVHPKRKAACSQCEQLWDNDDDKDLFLIEKEGDEGCDQPNVTTMDSANDTCERRCASNDTLLSQNLQIPVAPPQPAPRKRATPQTLNQMKFPKDIKYETTELPPMPPMPPMPQIPHITNTKDQEECHSQNLQCSMDALPIPQRKRYAAIQTALNPKSLSKEHTFDTGEKLHMSQHTHAEDQTPLHSQNLQCSMDGVHRKRLASAQTSYVNYSSRISKEGAFETDGPLLLSQHTHTPNRLLQSQNQECSTEPLRTSHRQRISALQTALNNRSHSNELSAENRQPSTFMKPRVRCESVNRAVATSYSHLGSADEKYTMNQTVNTIPDLPLVPSPRTPDMLYSPTVDDVTPHELEHPGPVNLSSRKGGKMDFGAVKPTYAPGKTHSKRDSKMRPFIFKPAHSEDNYPEDPTLPCPEIGLLSPCSPYRFEKEDPDPCEVKEEPRYLNALDASTDPAHCFRRSVEEDCALKDVVREFYKKTIATPNCVFKIPSPGNCDRQKCQNEQREREECEQQRTKRRFESGTLSTSSTVKPRMSALSRQSLRSRNEPPGRDSMMRKRSMEERERERDIERQREVDRERERERERDRERERERELERERAREREKEKEKEKPPAKKSSGWLSRDRRAKGRPAQADQDTEKMKHDAIDAKVRRRLEEEAKKANFKRADVVPDSEFKHGKNKIPPKPKKKTKTAHCQCPSTSPPIQTTLIKSSKHRPELYPPASDSAKSVDRVIENSSRLSKEDSSTKAAKVPSVPRSIPSAFPKTSRSTSKTKTAAWNVQSESGSIMGVNDSVRNVYASTSRSRLRSSRHDSETGAKDYCACSDKMVPLTAHVPSPVNTCSKSSCCSCLSKKKRKHSNAYRYDRARRRSSVMLTKVSYPSPKVFREDWHDYNKEIPSRRNPSTMTASRPKYLIKKDQVNLYSDYPRHSSSSCKKHRRSSKEHRRKRSDDAYDHYNEYTSRRAQEAIARYHYKHAYHHRVAKQQDPSAPLNDDTPSDDIKDIDQRPVKQSRRPDLDPDGYFIDNSDVGDTVATQASPEESSIVELTAIANCAKCLNVETRDTLCGGCPEEAGCKDCRCLREWPNVDPNETDHQKQWSPPWSKEIACHEIKCYLRSLCRNCKCDEHMSLDPPQHNSNSQNHVATALLHRGKANSELRRYLQSRWGTCRCSNFKSIDENERLSTDNNEYVIRNQQTTIGVVDVDSSCKMALCKNCNCVKKKLFLESCSDGDVLEPTLDVHFTGSGRTPKRMTSVVNQTDNLDQKDEKTSFGIGPGFQVDSKDSVERVISEDVARTTSVTFYTLPPAKSKSDAQRETKNFSHYASNVSQTKIDRQHSSGANRASKYNKPKEDAAIDCPVNVRPSDDACGLGEQQYSCKACLNKPTSSQTPKYKGDQKAVTDQTQIFPEKLSFGNEFGGPEDLPHADVSVTSRGSCIFKRKHLTVQKEPKRGESQTQPTQTVPEKLAREKSACPDQNECQINARMSPFTKCFEAEEPEPPQQDPCGGSGSVTRLKVEVKPKKLKSVQECGCPTFEKLLEQEILQNKKDAMKKQRLEAPHKTCQMPPFKPEDCVKSSTSKPKQTTRPSSSDSRIATQSKSERVGSRHKSAPSGTGSTAASKEPSKAYSPPYAPRSSRIPDICLDKPRISDLPCAPYLPSRQEQPSKPNIPAKQSVPAKPSMPAKSSVSPKPSPQPKPSVPAKPSQPAKEEHKLAPCQKISIPCSARRTESVTREDSKQVDTRDAAVDIRCPICTCATQCRSKQAPYRNKEIIEHMYEEIFTTDCTMDDRTMLSGSTSEENSEPSTLPIPSSSRSPMAVAFCDRLPKSRRMCPTCYKPVTKPRLKKTSYKRTNYGTASDRTRLKDISAPKGRFQYDKKRKKRRKRAQKTCDKSVCTEKRLVKFMSRAQVIPPYCQDVLSPSKYLLESQRQDNDIYSSKFAASAIFPALVNQYRPTGVCASKIKRNSQRGNRAKRTDELSARWQRHSPGYYEEFSRSDDTTRAALKYLKRVRRHKAKVDARFNERRRHYGHAVTGAEIKHSDEWQRNLHVYNNPAEDKMSLAAQCSASSF